MNNGDDSIELILENDQKIKRFVTECFSPPLTQNITKSLIAYFQQYNHDFSKEVDEKNMVKKIITLGQQMGDCLLGEDFELNSFVEIIEEHGFEQLAVLIESDRIEFFNEIWEATIFPESKFILSSVTNEFVRRFSSSATINLAELRYELKVTPLSTQQINQQLSAGQSDQTEYEKSPLTILHLVSRPTDFDLAFDSSNSMRSFLTFLGTQGAIDYQIALATEWEAIERLLSDPNNPIHVVHYDGPIQIEGDKDNLTCQAVCQDGKTTISFDRLCQALVKYRVGLLSVDARSYTQDEQTFNPATGLAMIAKSAANRGLGNVIGLRNITDPWHSSQCFRQIYKQIVNGFSVSQAVVEARKALQASTQSSVFTINGKDFHCWSLLLHFGGQPVTFFTAPHSIVEPNAPEAVEGIRQKLFGFHSESLPPLLVNLFDGQILNILQQVNNRQAPVLITGQEGIGKTTITHVISLYLSQKNQVDYCFYFNFAEENYTHNDMLEMIAPMLGLETNAHEALIDKLAHLDCCFVFDNLPVNTDAEAKISSSITLELTHFINNLIEQNHRILATAESVNTKIRLNFADVPVQKITPMEQQVLAVDSMRRNGLTEIALDSSWSKLQTSLDGHLWLLEKSLPQLNHLTSDELAQQIDININENNSSRVFAYYQWQWQSLPLVWQNLMLLCYPEKGLLLEMVMVACDQKQPFEPAKSLLKSLGDETANLVTGLELIGQAGFLTRFPHGHIIDSRCIPFLTHMQNSSEHSTIHDEKIKFAFSQVICKGIQLLSQHVLKQNNPSINHNLLINRRYWVKHFEKLWFAEDYLGFMSVKNSFEQLLKQANLAEESAVWSLNLLERSAKTSISDDTSNEKKLSWLALASQTLSLKNAEHNSIIKKGADIWKIWLAGQSESVDKQQVVLFHQSSAFLELYYKKRNNWPECKSICEKAWHVYSQYQAWPKVIQSLKSLAAYANKMGDIAECQSFEDRILNDVPYENSPEGFQVQQIVEILSSSLSRHQTQRSQQLLDKLSAMEESSRLGEMLDNFQADIYYQDQDYKSALPQYCKMWTLALQSENIPQIEQLKKILVELEDNLSKDYFSKCFEKQTPQNTVHPREYFTQVH